MKSNKHQDYNGAPLITALQDLQGFDIPEYDRVECSYTGANLTGVVYKIGGAGGSTVATLTLTYSGSDLTSVTLS